MYPINSSFSRSSQGGQRFLCGCLFALQCVVKVTPARAGFWKVPNVCFCVGGMTGRRGAREEHMEVPWMQVYLITGAKTHSQGSKADRDYWCTIQDSDGTRDRKVRLPGNRESGPPLLFLCFCLFQRLCHHLSLLFSVYFGP